MTRRTSRVYSSADGLIARAGRAAEDPAEMTREATDTKVARFIAEALKENPQLSPLQAARAGRLLLRADMARLARLSAAARRGDAA